ncbi:capsule biosynthesis protein [Oceanicella actignis]|uniref:capsule biosynthesis protein n=1 Tax=Oceanicella actignis TaxID=1189325 RepID=UPI001258BBDA|nr:capsular biosynthesis protein [Oceanicella actignis]TYO90516.1 capsular polysaccharide export protein [Oceanicella actignis]
MTPDDATRAEAAPAAPARRRVLLLQGPPSPFWRELAGAFEAAGHEALHVAVCTADRVYWGRRPTASYRGRFAGWRRWLEDFVARRGVTDILYYADRNPYHVVAAELAEERGLRAHALEFGYLRPDWLTLERVGMGAYSRFPDDPDAIRAIAERVRAEGFAPDMKTRHPHPFVQEAFNEVSFNLLNSLFFWPYPFYRMDRLYHPLLDFISWLPRLARRRRAEAHAREVTRACAARAFEYDLFALQLQSDYQIRDNCGYAGLEDAIEEVVASFARHAPPARRLVVKQHPLDNGLENWPARVARAAAAHGVAERVTTIDGGDLNALIEAAHGVIVVNSTVGLHAIRAGRPTAALGAAVFDVKGLTHQGPLDAFWREAAAPDRALTRDFVLALAATIQVKGSFYQPAGRARAQAEIVARVAGGRVNEPGAFMPFPPRLRPAPGGR